MTRPFRRKIAVAAALVAAAGAAAVAADPPLEKGLATLDAGRLLGHIKVLASDEFEGRAPGTPGEEKTVAYLTEQFQALGVAPGNPSGGYVQEVPLVGFQATETVGTIAVGGKSHALRFPEDWVAVSRRQAAEVGVEDSDLVFVGYGVVAPEYDWDDYKGVDVAGKTLVMLVNDPAVPDPADPSKLDPATFKGRAMTYYGRWTYKYEIATKKGAAAALLIHETEAAGYPFEVVTGSWGRENFDIATPGREVDRVAVEAWLSNARARAILADAGHDLDALKAAARRRDFRPVPLGGKARFHVKTALREVRSRNVIARIEGSDPDLKKDAIVFTAHWDHLGRDPKLPGDQIYNGAADNASGTAALIELARAFKAVEPAPKRSLLFLAVTAEEKGLLGARYYAENPLHPLDRTLANINMDVLNLWGPTSDVISVGLGHCTLDEVLIRAAAAQGRTVIGDAEPEKGFFYRSDHFEFAKKGVPALDTKAGDTYRGKPADFGKSTRDAYVKNDYHKVSDDVKDGWDLSGAIEDLKLLATVGYEVAQGAAPPTWKPGSEFKDARKATAAAARGRTVSALPPMRPDTDGRR